MIIPAGLLLLLAAPAKQPASFKVDVFVNGGQSDRICSIVRLDNGVGKAAKEQLPWAADLPLDLKVTCRRSTGEVMKIVRGVKGSMRLDLRVGYLIVWTKREGSKFRSRLDFELPSGEIATATPGAQVPLLAGRWSLRVVDPKKRGFFDTFVTVKAGETRELTVGMDVGRVRVDLGGQKGQFEAFDVENKSRGYAPAGQWLELPPGRYRLEASLDEDLVNHRWPAGEILLKPDGQARQSIRPRLATLRWGLDEAYAGLRVERVSDGDVVLDNPAGDRWRMAPGDYRVIYRLSSGDIAGLVSGEQVEEVTLKPGARRKVGKRPEFGRVIARLTRGNAPIYGMVELLSPKNGEVISRFPVGQSVRVAPGSWPLRVVASDGAIIPSRKLLKVRAKGQFVVDLKRRQSRLRLTMLKAGQRSSGTWLITSKSNGKKRQAVSGEAMDLDPGRYELRAVCANGRTSSTGEVIVELGVDQDQETLCD